MSAKKPRFRFTAPEAYDCNGYFVYLWVGGPKKGQWRYLGVVQKQAKNWESFHLTREFCGWESTQHSGFSTRRAAAEFLATKA